MKIKSIETICKQEKNVHLWQRTEGTFAQWVSTSGALYALEGVPPLNAAQFRTLLDVDEDKLSVTEEKTEPTAVNVSDDDPDEREAEELGIGITIRGIELRAVKTAHGVLLFRERYFSPFSDEEGLRFFTRLFHSGEPYLVAKRGFFFLAILAPYRVEEQAKDDLMWLAKEIKTHDPARIGFGIT